MGGDSCRRRCRRDARELGPSWRVTAGEEASSGAGDGGRERRGGPRCLSAIREDLGRRSPDRTSDIGPGAVAELALHQGGPVLQWPSTEDMELKNRLLNKYSGYLSSLWSSRGRRRKASCRGTRARSSSTGSSSTTGGPTPRYVIELFTRRPISIMPAGPTRSCRPLQQQLGVSRPHCFSWAKGGP